MVGRLTANAATAERAKPLFHFLHEYESRYGELSQITRLEKRMHDLYPDDPNLGGFSKRFVSPTFDPTVVVPLISPQQMRPSGFEAPQRKQWLKRPIPQFPG